MANYNTTTKIMIGSISEKADSVTGSIAKEINDYFQTVTDTKTIRATATATVGQMLIYVVVHDS